MMFPLTGTEHQHAKPGLSTPSPKPRKGVAHGKTFSSGGSGRNSIVVHDHHAVYSYSGTFMNKEAVSEELQYFIQQLTTSSSFLFAREAGAGGDCLFHSIGAVLTRMHLSPVQAARDFIDASFGANDFISGKQHLVQKLRGLVALHVSQESTMTAEDLLNFVISSLQQCRIPGGWLDQWDPLTLLHGCGFPELVYCNNVHAVGANEHGRPTDIIVSFDNGQGDRDARICVPDGASHLMKLRQSLYDIFNACGNMHWATDVDVRAISEALHVGFIIFTDFPQDSGSHIYSLHQTHANYDWWILLYWFGRVHYKLMEWTDVNLGQGHYFFHRSNLPPVLLQAYNDANPSCPIGHVGRSDVS